jgi:primosomal protein N' (replication factor Y)
MTWHEAERRLRCHHCAFELGYPGSCPTCGAEELTLLGQGSEQVEELLRRALPEARIERMDRDTVRRRGAHESLLRRFEAHEIDILVGTQMIAKGHDFPNVTLVGVLSADQSLGLPDFRAAERTFQLLTQVAGRAGRGERPGRVLIQAFDPAHPLLRQAARQEFEAFYEREIEYRRALRYPPLTAMVQLLVVDSERGRAAEWADLLAESLRDAGGGRLLLVGPGPAPIERLKGRHRQQILVRSAGRRRLVEAVGQALAAVAGEIPQRAVVVDVDPMTVL